MKRSAAVAAVLATAFFWGFVGETMSLFDEFWSSVLLLSALVLLLTVALAASVGEKVTLLTAVTAVALGLLGGGIMGITFVLGAFSPFALELGERDLNDVGGDIGWDVSLTLGLMIWGGGGAVLGAACGTAAWALRFGLGQVRSDRGRAKREAAGER